MILQALVAYYEALAEKGKISRPGWSRTRVQYALELDESGKLLSLLPLESMNEKGKPIPRYFELPTQFKRSGSRAPAYFLCDNSQYCLGLENGAVTEKSKRCFAAFAEYHRKMLAHADSPCARALVNFVNNWNPENAANNKAINSSANLRGNIGNFIFVLRNGEYMHENPVIVKLWDEQEKTEDEVVGRCLATGENAPISRIHNSIKGIYSNALSPNGWTLVGFDKDAFCSYGKTQSYNAPVSKYAAFAYTTALNQLVADRDHTKLIGDTTVVYWAQSAETQYQDVFGFSLEGNAVENKDLVGVVEALSQGKTVDWDGLPLHPDNHFYVLGLAPNAARLSVRFFLQDSFGAFERRLNEHFKRLEIVRPDYDRDVNLPMWKLLIETIRDDPKKSALENMKKVSPQLAGDTLRAILTGGRYPSTLYQQTMLRVRAEHNLTRGKAAIIKAYLLRNGDKKTNKEALTVQLNEETVYQPYVLGRMFSVLEDIQQSANPGINATIRDKYFTSACATPAVVFPTILNLAGKHLRKLDARRSVYFSKQLGALTGMITESYPTHLSLSDQGIFQLGYYHQTQKRYEKKSDTAVADNNKEEIYNV